MNKPQTVALRSTCNMEPYSGTSGFVSVEAGSWRFPISIAGLAGGNIKRFLNDETVDPTEETNTYIKTRKINACKTLCTNVTSTVKQRIDYTITNNLFLAAFTEQVSDHLPVWFEIDDNVIASGGPPDYSVKGLLAKLVSRDVLESSNCVPRVNGSILYPMDGSERYVMHQTNSFRTIKIMNGLYQSSGTNQMCFSIGLEKEKTLNIFTDVPFTLISAPSPDHVIEKLQSSFISVTPNKSEIVIYIDFKVKTKSFNGIFESKSLLAWSDSTKVR